MEKDAKQVVKKEEHRQGSSEQPSFIRQIADEVAKTLMNRLPGVPSNREQKPRKTNRKGLEKGVFLDTSAIIDARVFELILRHILEGPFFILEGVLLELKHIADSQDMIRRERGRRGLEYLEKAKKAKGIRVVVLSGHKDFPQQVSKEVDEQLIFLAKKCKGKIVTCDYNLEKKAAIHGIVAINMHAVAQVLKVSAVPGESLHLTIVHKGKEDKQGVAYLEDGTMIVVELGEENIGETIDVVVSRVIQTASGSIFFAKKI